MTQSNIEWTGRVWNPITGCNKVSPGCAHCYAETFAERWRGIPGHHFEKGFDLQLRPERLGLPLSWKKPTKIFVNSMSDLFHKDVPNDFIRAVFTTMANCPQHTFQILTKRARDMRDLLTRWEREGLTLRSGYGVRLPNVWLGVSVENQAMANERIPHLLNTPAAVRWISAEPLLGPVDLAAISCPNCGGAEHMGVLYGSEQLDWVVVGGESGNGRRPFDPDWARTLRDQCAEAKVPFFMKQLGGPAQNKHGDLEDLPEDLRIRQYPA